MAKKKVYRFWNHCQGRKKSRERRFSGHSLCPGNGARRRSGRSSALPYPPSSAAILPPRLVFATGRFFVVNY
jgi:hypothetical protein